MTTTITDERVRVGIEAATRCWMSNPSFDDAIRAALTAAAQVGKLEPTEDEIAIAISRNLKVDLGPGDCVASATAVRALYKAERVEPPAHNS